MTMYSESLRAFLKPVVAYLDDESVSEILINGPEDIWIERKGKLTKTDARFTEEGLLGAARNMAQFMGRMLNDERPRLDARLPDGSRIHVVLPPVARKGTTISIRKFFKDKLTIDALLKFNSLSAQMARLIDAAIHLKLNTVVAGGTGSGKTTLLNLVSSLIPDDERILTIEDSAELQLNQQHLVPFESRPPDKFGKGEVNMGDLLNSALRLRPDRIVVGEVRGGEAFHLMQAMNTGHGGSLATVHANTPTDTLRRLESLCLMSGVDLPMVAVRSQVASAINLVICCERLHDGSRKVTSISEVLPLSDKGDYRTQDLFVFTPVTKDEEGNILGYHAPTGILPTFLGRARAYGFADLDERFFDPATYQLPAPPQFHVGEEVRIRWAASLKHREKGQPDPESFQEQWRRFEQKLKTQSGVATKPPPAATASVAAPAPAPVAPVAAPPTPVRAAPPRPAAAPPASARASTTPTRELEVVQPPPGPATTQEELPPEDKTPAPTRPPSMARPPPEPETRPMNTVAADPRVPRVDAPKVEVDESYLAEVQGEPRPAAPARLRPAQPTPSRPAGARPAPKPADDNGGEQREGKTRIRPAPERPKR